MGVFKRLLRRQWGKWIRGRKQWKPEDKRWGRKREKLSAFSCFPCAWVLGIPGIRITEERVRIYSVPVFNLESLSKTSLVVQSSGLLRSPLARVRDMGSIPGLGKSHMPLLFHEELLIPVMTFKARSMPWTQESRKQKGDADLGKSRGPEENTVV